jgi:hypothetical protein
MVTEMAEHHNNEVEIMADGLIYEFTKDPDLLEQYYKIREDGYKEAWGLKVFSGAEDEHDKRGHILIVREGRRVIGGGRLVLRSTGSPVRLPMETEGFLLHEVLPEIGSDETVIGEVGRAAVLPDFKGGKSSSIGLHLLAKSQLHNCQYLFTVAPVEQALKYRETASGIGIEITVMDDVPVADHPYYNDIEMRLVICDVSHSPDCRNLLEKK